MAKHIDQLDSVRAIAIGLVLITHFWGYPADHQVANAVAAAGWMGVDIFFVLSGFLITGILRDTRDDPRHFINFYFRRALRIWPLYLLLLLIVLVLLPLVKEMPAAVMEDKWLYWMHAGNFALADGGWQLFLLDITWSLSLEEQFYLIWPAVIYRMSNRRVMALCLALIIAMPLVRIVLWEPLGWMWLHMLFRADSFAVGGLLAVAMRERIDLSHAKWLALLWIPIWSLVAAEEFRRESMLVGTIGYSMTALASAGLLLIAMDLRAFSWRPSVYVGKVSYGIYIYHPLCLMVASLALGEMSGWTRLIGITALTIAVASISFYAYETPLLRLKRFFVPGRARSDVLETGVVQ